MLRKIAFNVFNEKLAGYKQIRRYLEHVKIPNENARQILLAKIDSKNIPKGPHNKLNFLTGDSASDSNVKALANKAVSATTLPYPKIKRDSNLANIKGRIEEANKDLDILHSRYHGTLDNTSNTQISPKKQGLGVLIRGRSVDEPYYYKGTHSAKGMPGGSPYWVSPLPSVASRYGNAVLKYKNTPELLEGSSPRSHIHMAKDTRNFSPLRLGLTEKLVGLGQRLNLYPKFSTNAKNYERVLTYDKDRMKNNVQDVYTRKERFRPLTLEELAEAKRHRTGRIYSLNDENAKHYKVTSKIEKKDIIDRIF